MFIVMVWPPRPGISALHFPVGSAANIESADAINNKPACTKFFTNTPADETFPEHLAVTPALLKILKLSGLRPAAYDFQNTLSLMESDPLT
jgi:hypothetical protein